MQITGRFLKVWKVEERNGYRFIDISEGEKQKNGTYINSNWYGCMLVGNAKEIAVEKGDLIRINSGKLTKREYQGKYYDNIVIFDFELEENKKFEKNEFDEEIPF